ncbi:MAG: YIP1 family protein [Chthoniobacterales bacterium]
MGTIQVNRGETKLGVFSEEEIREGLSNGRFLPTDLFWREGMPTWLTLAQFPAAESATAGAAVPGVAASGVAIVPQGGLPWDRRQELGFFPAFFETLKLVLLNPAVAFANMKPEGGLVDPLIYAVIGGSVGWVFYFIFSFFLGSLGALGNHNMLGGMVGLGFGGIFVLIFFPIMLAIGLFIGAGIVHLCLMLVGGAKRSYETTLQVLCYSVGSTYPLMIVPACGGAIASVWCLVVECVGLAKAHETTTGKAVLAVFLPLIVCCGGGFVLVMVLGGVSALSGHH